MIYSFWLQWRSDSVVIRMNPVLYGCNVTTPMVLDVHAVRCRKPEAGMARAVRQ